MKILVFGSANIDYTYRMPHLVQEGETCKSIKMEKNIGGKGLNQAIALAKSGLSIYYAAMIGEDGVFLCDFLKTYQVDTSNVRIVDCPTGNAIIQVDEEGKNSIILFGGANEKVDEQFIDQTLEHFSQGDYVIVQNEISNLPLLIEKAKKQGMRVILNPSPVTPSLLKIPAKYIDMYILNEIEGAQITGQISPDAIVQTLLKNNENTNVLLTLGEQGARFVNKEMDVFEPARTVKVVDTTAAGDTFTGYFLQAYFQNKPIEYALKQATQAAAITVSRNGASISIPLFQEVQEKMVH